MIGSAGAVFPGIGTSGGADAVLAGVAIWILCVFIGLVVALQGVIVLIEGVIDSSG